MKLGQHASRGTMVQARIYQDAWIILAGAVVVIVIAIAMNWRNSATGYWINLTLVFLLDLPFVLFVLVPGLAPMLPGLQGPIAFALAAACSGFALLTRPRISAAPRETRGLARTPQPSAT